MTSWLARRRKKRPLFLHSCLLSSIPLVKPPPIQTWTGGLCGLYSPPRKQQCNEKGGKGFKERMRQRSRCHGGQGCRTPLGPLSPEQTLSYVPSGDGWKRERPTTHAAMSFQFTPESICPCWQQFSHRWRPPVSDSDRLWSPHMFRKLHMAGHKSEACLIWWRWLFNWVWFNLKNPFPPLFLNSTIKWPDNLFYCTLLFGGGKHKSEGYCN